VSRGALEVVVVNERYVPLSEQDLSHLQATTERKAPRPLGTVLGAVRVDNAPVDPGRAGVPLDAGRWVGEASKQVLDQVEALIGRSPSLARKVLSVHDRDGVR